MRLIMLLMVAAVTVSAQASEVMKVRVTGGSVGLRAVPGIDGQLVNRARRGDELVFIEKANGWVAVQAPASLEYWISSAYVNEGVVVKANPGLYRMVLNENGVERPICLVRGKSTDMERYLNRSMLMKGKKYWAKDVALPIVQPIKIYL